MSIPLTVNGAVFEYPVDFDENWGVDATGWAQAVTNGMLQMQGGSFPLTANVNFGPNFGLLSQFFQTRSASPATTGTVRLSSADTGIVWRNNANSANLILTTNASDQLLYNGNAVATNGSSPTFAVVTHISNLVLKDSGLQSLTVSAPTTLTTPWTFTYPVDDGLSGQVLSTDGLGNTSWINAAGGGTVNSGNQYEFAYYAANGTTISGNSNTTTNVDNQILTVDGAINIPSYSFTSDTDTGIYLHTANQIGVTVGGVSRLRVSTSDVISLLPLNMTSNPVTSVADATNTTDAAAFGQVAVRQIVYASSTAPFSTSNAAFQTTNLTGTITPSSASSSRILILVNGTLTMQGNFGVRATIANGTTNLAASEGLASNRATSNASGTVTTPCSMSIIDTPGSSSAQTYNVRIKSDGTNTASFGITDQTQTMILMELI